jgi:hypothetical protein
MGGGPPWNASIGQKKCMGPYAVMGWQRTHFQARRTRLRESTRRIFLGTWSVPEKRARPWAILHMALIQKKHSLVHHVHPPFEA